MAALNQELFLPQIREVLFADNEFLNYITRLDSAFDGAESVPEFINVPVSGAMAAATRGTPVRPLPVLARTDINRQLQIRPYRTPGAFEVESSEQAYLAYDKRASLMRQMFATVADRIATDALRTMAPATAGIIRTTSGTTVTAASGLLPYPGSTGTAARILADDFYRARQIMDDRKLPKSGRYAAIPPAFYRDIMNIPEFIRAENMGQAVIPDGVIGKIGGIQIIVRPDLPLFNGSGTPALKVEGSAPDLANDAFGIIFWQRDYVHGAIGAFKLFLEEDSATLQATLMSGIAYAGFLVPEAIGTLALVQARA
jgi:hypothetical protein